MPRAGLVPVLVVDDQAQFRAVMRDVVGAGGSFRLVGEAESGEAAVEAVERLAPRLVIMDKRMPGVGGIEACRMIRRQHPDVVVVICSVEEPNPQLARDCGASGFVRKQELSPRLLRDIWQAFGPTSSQPSPESGR